MLEIIFFSFIAISSGFAVYKWQEAKQLKKQVSLQNKELENYRSKYEQAIAAEINMKNAKEDLDEIEQELRQAIKEKELAKEKQYEAEKKEQLAMHSVKEMEGRIKDWEKTKDESMKIAKAAMFESGSQLFKKEADEVSKKTTEKFESVIKSVAALNDKIVQSEDKVDVVWKSLTTPHAVGCFSEIGLENTLKEYGLEAGRDFVMQYSVGSGAGALRPDAVVFLPAGNLMVIDSKASQFFIELAKVEGSEKEEEVLEKLKKTMNTHLKSLSSKSYKESVAEYLKAAGKDEEISHIYTVMFVHSEANVEKIIKADAQFIRKAREHDIILSGPTGISSAMSLAKFEISEYRKHNNNKQILSEISNLLGSIGVVLSHVNSVGKGIERAAKGFSDMVSSVNRNMLPKARKISKLGVDLPKNKQLPENLQSFYLAKDNQVIEGEFGSAENDDEDYDEKLKISS